MAGRICGKVAVITGAASGLGRAGALIFAQEGAKIVAADVNADAVQETVTSVVNAGGEAVAVQTDVTKLAEVRHLIHVAVANYGKVDIMWNNAGVLQSPPVANIEEMEESDWDRVLSINLKGVFLGTKCVVPQMKKQGGGVIVNTASIAGIRGQAPGMAAYSASKGGVVNLTRELSTELGPYNIRVNAVAPGTMRTPMLEVFGNQSVAFDQGKTNATRSVSPEEIARTCLHLVSDDVGPLTGAIVPVDGGRTANAG